MAAAIMAIKRKNEKRRAGRTENRRQSLSEPPAWAKACLCWTNFWSQTQIDDKFWSLQPAAKRRYDHKYSQVFVACLIGGNFICTMIEMQIDPSGDKYEEEFYILECVFNICFFIELLLNMYANWFWRFIRSAWNWFDLIVVIIGMMSVFKALDGPLTLLRNMRAFRVFRLFKRIKALNKILVSLGRAVSGVSSAFVVVFIVMSIYAILGVSFFRNAGKEGYMVMAYGTGAIVPTNTPRGTPYGEEYFGNFGRALYTLFQVLLGDSWSEVIARPLMYADEPDFHTATVYVYIISFLLLNTVVLTNVVVAVLLEKVIDDGSDDDAQHAEDSKQKRKSTRNDSERRKSSAREASLREDPSWGQFAKIAPNNGTSSPHSPTYGGSSPTPPSDRSSPDLKSVVYPVDEAAWKSAPVVVTAADHEKLRADVQAIRAELAGVTPVLEALQSELKALREAQEKR